MVGLRNVFRSVAKVQEPARRRLKDASEASAETSPCVNRIDIRSKEQARPGVLVSSKPSAAHALSRHAGNDEWFLLRHLYQVTVLVVSLEAERARAV